MKIRNILTVWLVAIILASCAPAAKVVPTETAVPTSIFTPIPPAITPTSTPTIQVNSFSVPDPKYTNPELFDLQNAKSPIPQFIKAMSMAGIEISPENVIRQITYQESTQANGKPYIVGLYNLDPDSSKTGEALEGEVPLLIAFQDDNGLWVWKKTTIGNLSTMIAMNSGTLLEGGGAPEYEVLKAVQRDNFNFGVVTVHQGLQSDSENTDYGYSDFEVRDAGKGIPLMTSMFIWPSRIPDWLQNGGYNKQQIMDIMNDWIINSMKRYPEIKFWQVVNEAHTYNDFFRKNLGNDYFIQFFKIARQVRPDAILIYNDYGNHSLLESNSTNGNRTQITAQIIEKLQDDNLIDGVGVQLVIYADMLPSPEDVTNTLRSYGVPVYITEFQVIMTEISGSREERWLKQAQIYSDMVIVIKNSGVCNTVIYWNQSDKLSPWENQQDLPEYSLNADPSLFDDNFNPKPAYYAVIQALYKPLP